MIAPLAGPVRVPTLGIALPTRSGLRPARLAALAGAAEHAGFDGCFVAERCSDGLAVLAAIAAATSTIEIGTAISNIYARHPALLAMTCAAVDDVSGGRLSVGLGTGNPVVTGRQLGIRPAPPLSTMREYVAVIRNMSLGSPVSFRGEVFRIDDLAPDVADWPAFPLHIGALQPRMRSLAAQIGDGVILNLAHRPSLENIVTGIRTEVDESRADTFRIACVIPVCVTHDDAAGLNRGRTVIAGYSMHPAAARLFRQHGYSDVVEAVQACLLAGDRAGALRKVPDHMVADFVLVGSADRCRDALAIYRGAGVDLPIVFPVEHPQGWEEAIAELMSVPSQHRGPKCASTEGLPAGNSFVATN